MRFMLLILAVLCLSSCSTRDYQGMNEHPAEQHQGKGETADQKVHRLEGELATAKADRDEARLAPARTSLNWASGILALATIGGLVAAIFMKSRLLGYGALACAAGAIAAQVTNRALDHVTLISWLALAALAAGGAVMVWRYHHD